MALLVVGLACGHFNSGARLRGEDVFRVLLAEPAPDVPIVGDTAVVPPGAVLLGYAIEVSGRHTKGVRVIQGWNNKKVRVRSGWLVVRLFTCCASNKVPSGVTQRPIYTVPDAKTPFNFIADGAASYKKGHVV